MTREDVRWPDDEPDSELDGPDNPLRLPDEAALLALLRHFATKDAPRVFAVCEVARGWRAARVLAWGMAFVGQAVLFLPDDHTVGVFSSAERAAAMFGMGKDVRLVWPDFVPSREMATS